VVNAIWWLIVGGLLMSMSLVGSALKRLPLTAAMVYLAIGFALGPTGAGLMSLRLPDEITHLRMIAEVGILVSLFAIGLRLRVPPSDRRWALPLRLGVLAMMLTVASLALLGILAFHLSVGVAVLLGAMMAPTDPVLAHDVGVREAGDVELVRFTLSGEGGLNDGTAYPFALLGLLLCDAAGHDGMLGISWAFVGSVTWGVIGGIGGGWLLGVATARFVAFMRSRHGQALGLEGFFALGLIALSYGVALITHGYGFLAVFAAGVAMRRVEHQSSGDKSSREAVGTVDAQDVEATATDPERAHAFIAESVLGFSIELEHIAEVALMLLIGCLVSQHWVAMLTWHSAAVVAALLIVIRPLAAQISLIGSSASRTQRWLIGWLGIRGVGSVYYLMLALERGPRTELAPVIPWVLAAISTSVVLHGISATPLMRRYGRDTARRG
jgi:NhaP-type Na+/H+ or K+/H+ antiporter